MRQSLSIAFILSTLVSGGCTKFTGATSSALSSTSQSIGNSGSNPVSGLIISSPAANTQVSGSVNITGLAQSSIVNVSAYDANGNKISTDTTPVNQNFSLTVNTTSLANGSATISLKGFTVAAGQLGGTTYSASLVLNVANSGSSTVAAPSAGDINLTGYTMTFDEEFNSLSISTATPKGSATWYYWPPYGPAGGYSESTWDASAFSVSNGILSNKLFKDSSGNYHSGNISSIDPNGAGFSQQYGYFEARVKMPASGTGSWPAFWLMTKNDAANSGKTTVNEEIDIFEWYGNTKDSNQNLVQQATHNWNTDGSQNSSVSGLYSPTTPYPNTLNPWDNYHIYGCQVDASHVTWYIDGVKTNQIATPTSYISSPFYMMLDYAIGGGWPLTGVVNNSVMSVDWVRVYSLPAGS